MERTVELDPSHLQRFMSKPIKAIEELISNAFDADADEIDVELTRNAMGGVTEIRVNDDGHGMTYDEAWDTFGRLGGSWKKSAAGTRGKNRSLRGREGEGRYRAATQGRSSRWETVAETPEGRNLVVVDLTSENLRKLIVNNVGPTDRPTGTRVVLGDFLEPPIGLDGQEPADTLTRVFAKHLTQYPNATLRFDETEIDPRALQLDSYDVDLGAFDGLPATLEIVEWKRNVGRSLFLCTEDGTTVDELKAGIRAPDFFFCGYARWSGFTADDDSALNELDSGPAGAVIEASRDAMRMHFRGRRDERNRAVIGRWKADLVYPYDAEPVDQVERTERALFDVVAFTAREAIDGAGRSKKLQLRLLKEALTSDPGSLHRVLEEVLDLGQEQLDELALLLDRTTFAGIMAMSRAVSERLEFLQALRLMVFDPDLRQRVKERSQLHRMLAAESWIFGEEWALLVDDQNLDAVLHQHLRRLGPDREALAATDVRDGEGKTRIVDLMLGRSTELAEERHQHLVIELKAPAVTVGPRELEQIENYADAVVNDSQFDLHTTSWDFIVVSSDLHRRAQTRATQKDRPRGLIHEYADANVRIWALTWSQIIRNAEHRMKFVKRNLGYSPTTDHAIDLLHRKHAEFLPGPLVAATDEQPEHLDADPRPLGSDGTHLHQD